MPKSSPFSKSKLLQAWLESGRDEATFLARRPVPLNEYEESALQLAGVELTPDTIKFFQRAKALLGEVEFSELAGQVKERGVHEIPLRFGKEGEKDELPHNVTGVTIGLFIHRVATQKISAPIITPASGATQLSLAPVIPLATTEAVVTDEKVMAIAAKRHDSRVRRKIELCNTITSAPCIDRDRMAFTSVALAQVNLPHSDPGPIDVWERRNGDWTFILTPGRMRDGDAPSVNLGCPYGAFPRLVLIHMITEAKRTQDRRIKLNDTFYGFLKQLGIGDSKQNYRSMREQLTRLLGANLQYVFRRKTPQANGMTMIGQRGFHRPIAKEYGLWWLDRPADNTGELFESYVVLDQDFFEAVIGTKDRSYVFPLDLDTITAIKKSSVQLDLYAWLVYRIYKLVDGGKDQALVPWDDLHQQLSVDFKETRMFRYKIKQSLANLALYWRGGLNYEVAPEGLIVKPSPLPVEATRKERQIG